VGWAWRDPAGAVLLAIVVACVAFVTTRAYWLVCVLKEAVPSSRREWPSEKLRLDEQHRRNLEAHSERRRIAEEQWVDAERARIAELKRLLVGELDAVERAVSEQVAQLDFPFEADCAIGVDDEDHVMIDIDLPEIEDVVPETELSVLKDGSLKEVKRKASARNEAYGTLVIGIAFTVAASAFSSAPTLRTVTVAGHTQRKSRTSLDAVDAYVYEVRFRREAFASLDGRRLDPMDAVRRLDSRIDIAPNGVLKKLPEPSWAAALWNT
jgi:hypothetical protein